MERLLTAQQVDRALSKLYRLIAQHVPADAPLAVIGMRSRGDVLAERLLARLKADRPDQKIHRGVLDITFYRDDLSMRKGMPLVRATQIDFDLDDKLVLLVDDVLATGRSIRAALDALTDFGRPRAIRLAVLLDRGGRELPIAADFVGAAVEAPPRASVQVCLKEVDGEDAVYLVESKPSRGK
jgi:pyrimidine operon attenuation protein/uracil phosphoribosyltransferase